MKTDSVKTVPAKRVRAQMPARKPAARLEEDWLPVIIGALMILLVLLGVRLVLPGFKWQSGPEFAAAAARMQPAVGELITEADAQG